MSARNQRGQTTEYGYGKREQEYVYGNAVRKIREREEREVRRKRVRRAAVRKNRENARRMNFGYVLFLTAASVITAAILTVYIRLQSEITSHINHIAYLESQLNAIKLSNDEEYSRIESSVNLEEIKRVAIEELGMTYAAEGQVIEYSSEGSDYVRQLENIP